jgi:adenylosuccinate lyase
VRVIKLRVWTSSFWLLPVEILSIPRWVALFVADISLLFRYHLCSLQNEIQKLEIYFKKLLKQVQNLPERTANEATYLMMGRIPVIRELHKRILKTKSFQYLDG